MLLGGLEGRVSFDGTGEQNRRVFLVAYIHVELVCSEYILFRSLKRSLYGLKSCDSLGARIFEQLSLVECFFGSSRCEFCCIAAAAFAFTVHSSDLNEVAGKLKDQDQKAGPDVARDLK